MPTPIVTLPLDYSGQSPDNLIPAELHDVTQCKLIVLDFGSFFKESLQLVDANTLTPLNPTQYMVMDLYQDMTIELGKEIYNTIVITDSALTGNIAVTYQALGGPFCRHSARLVQWLEERKINIGTMAWEDIEDKPKKYKPSHHNHHVSHIYGEEYIIEQLKRVETGILTGKIDTYNAVTAVLERKKTEMTQKAKIAVDEMLLGRFNGFTGFSNRSGISLSQVEDLAIMSAADGVAVANPAFDLVSVTTEKYVTSLALNAFYKEARNNVVNKEDTNLGMNEGMYGKPTRGQFLTAVNGTTFWLPSMKAAVEAGDSPDDGIYPEGVAETDEFLFTKLNGNETNYGGMYLLVNSNTLDTYIGSLENDACSESIKWNKMLFKGELDPLAQLIEDHIADNKNPHEVDKTDIKLHKVENLPVITTDEIINKESAKKYLTLDTLMYYMKMFMTNAQPPAPPGETLDPNAKTMDDVQIIFSACKKPTPQDDGAAPKGQLLKTFCDKKTLFARYTDGNGSWYDEVLEKNSADCT